jgi:hypothetical protein
MASSVTFRGDKTRQIDRFRHNSDVKRERVNVDEKSASRGDLAPEKKQNPRDSKSNPRIIFVLAPMEAIAS